MSTSFHMWWWSLHVHFFVSFGTSDNRILLICTTSQWARWIWSLRPTYHLTFMFWVHRLSSISANTGFVPSRCCVWTEWPQWPRHSLPYQLSQGFMTTKFQLQRGGCTQIQNNTQQMHSQTVSPTSTTFKSIKHIGDKGRESVFFFFGTRFSSWVPGSIDQNIYGGLKNK